MKRYGVNTFLCGVMSAVFMLSGCNKQPEVQQVTESTKEEKSMPCATEGSWEGMRSTKQDRIHFEFDSAKITDEDEAEKLSIALRGKNIEKSLGFCDIRGSSEYNDGLGLRRGQEALNYLASKGNKTAKKARAVSMGNRFLLNKENNEAAHSENRVAVIIASEESPATVTKETVEVTTAPCTPKNELVESSEITQVQ